MNARRSFLTTTAIIAPALALAACTPGTSGTSTQVEQVIAQIQALLPFVDVLAAGLAIAVPAAASVVVAIEPYLGTAQAALNTLSSTMAASAAAPVVTQIENAIGAAVQIIGQFVNAPGADPKLAKFAPLVAQAGAVVSLLNAFVNAAAGVITPKASLVVPRSMHIRTVR